MKVSTGTTVFTGLAIGVVVVAVVLPRTLSPSPPSQRALATTIAAAAVAYAIFVACIFYRTRVL